jgi:AmiR/NasT family two-component response regulator
MTPAKPSGLRIVVADDERDVRQFLQEMLTHLGHQVLAQAETGRQLVERCRALKPDLVITDIRMPDMDGLEAAEAIERDRPVPVIIVSAHSDAALLDRASAGSVMTYLIKPVKPADLQAAITMAAARFEQMHNAAKEVAQLRQALEDRKLIERAKGIVSRRLRVEEAEAFRKLQKMASINNRKLADVSQQVLNSDKVFQELEACLPA